MGRLDLGKPIEQIKLLNKTNWAQWMGQSSWLGKVEYESWLVHTTKSRGQIKLEINLVV